MKTYDFKAS